MLSFKIPDEFKPLKHPAEDWEKWRKRFMIYYGAAGIAGKTESQQRDILLHIMGDAGIEIFEASQMAEPVKGKVIAILDEITKHYRPYRNITYRRHAFWTATQAEISTIDQFVAELGKKAKDCEFGDLTESLIRDRLICGLRDGDLRERLLREGDLSLPMAISMCRAHEISKAQSQLLIEPGFQASTVSIPSELSVDAMHKRNVENGFKKISSYGKSEKTVYKCNKCLREHLKYKCPAYRKKCNKCSRYGHFAVACQKLETRETHANVVERGACEDSDGFFMGSLHLDSTEGTEDWLEEIAVGENRFVVKLDTGSQINVLPSRVYNNLKNKPALRRSQTHVVSYSDHVLKIKGMCKLKCETKKGTKGLYEFAVIDTKFRPILGASACENLQLVKRIDVVDSSKSTQNIISEYKQVFQGLGQMPGLHHIKLKEGTSPTVCMPRRIPFALQDKVKEELKSMEQKGIIERVERPTEWVHPMVVIGKPKGQIRICIDPRQLNLAVEREHLQLPTQETLLSQLNGAKYFTVLDAASAFHQIRLDQKSSDLCTFATPFGRFRFTRLPFGLKSAPEVFQKVINKALQDLPGTLCYFDDILIYGCTKEEHDTRLSQVLQRAKENNLRFDKNKMQLAQTTVKYLGNIISSEGIGIMPERVTAIKNLSAPKEKKDLQRFLGMINYVSRFLPGLSSKTAYIRQLLKKDVMWQWDAQADQVFNQLKKMVAEAPSLCYFDPNKRITLSADASQFGVGATLMQNGNPVAYASATLTTAQRGYAQIEKELLAIVFACERFHYYIYGQEVDVETDHKPLVSIAQKSYEKMSPRIQRMILRLQRYQTKIKYVPGKQQYISDTLSRDPELTHMDTDFLETEAGAVHQLISVSPPKLKAWQEATSKDEQLHYVAHYCQTGWPRKMTSANPATRDFWPYREELHYSQQLVFRGTKIVIPTTERLDILKKLHESHLGVVACKDRARQLVFWPGITGDIETFVKNCESCLMHSRANTKEPLLPHPIVEKPWEKIGMDFMQIKGKEYILAIDYHSKFVEVQPMMKTTAEPVIQFIKSISARHGIPQIIMSDNGPPFESQAMKTFMENWDIQHISSSPLYARSNGMVERAIQTLKTRLNKSAHDQTDPYLVLLNYRATPHNGLASPTELLMGRKIRTRVPMTDALLEPKFPTEVTKEQLRENQIQQKYYADQGAIPLKPLAVGQPVVYNYTPKEWKAAVITSKAETPRSYNIITPDGRGLRRNRLHLRPNLRQNEMSNIPQVTPKGAPKDLMQEEQTAPCITSEEPQQMTRCRRVIKPPERYKD